MSKEAPCLTGSGSGEDNGLRELDATSIRTKVQETNFPEDTKELILAGITVLEMTGLTEGLYGTTIGEISLAIKESVTSLIESETFSATEHYTIINILNYIEKSIVKAPLDEQQILLSNINSIIYQVLNTTRLLPEEEYKALASEYIKKLKESITLFGGTKIEKPLQNVYLQLYSLAAKKNGATAEAIYYFKATDISEYSQEELYLYYFSLGECYRALGFEVSSFNIPDIASEYFLSANSYFSQAKAQISNPDIKDDLDAYLDSCKQIYEPTEEVKPGLLHFLFQETLGYYIAQRNTTLVETPIIAIPNRTFNTLIIPISSTILQNLERYFRNEMDRLAKLERSTFIIRQDSDGFNIIINTTQLEDYINQTAMTIEHPEVITKTDGYNIPFSVGEWEISFNEETNLYRMRTKLTDELSARISDGLASITELPPPVIDVDTKSNIVTISNLSITNYRILQRYVITPSTTTETAFTEAKDAPSTPRSTLELLSFIEQELLRQISYSVTYSSTALPTLEIYFSSPKSWTESIVGFNPFGKTEDSLKQEQIRTCLSKIIGPFTIDDQVKVTSSSIIISNIPDSKIETLRQTIEAITPKALAKISP